MAKQPRPPSKAAVERGISGIRLAGWVLAHNHVSRAYNTTHGSRGFRRFWVPPSKKWKLCKCGWRPDLGPHYALYPNQKAYADESICQELARNEHEEWRRKHPKEAAEAAARGREWYEEVMRKCKAS